jgi:putative secretion ATPase (PEP-CTERM system associated)
MYERFYQLRERPFALSPDPEYLYPSRVHREALDYLRYGLESQAGFVVITGEIGSGKTTLLQTLLRGLDSQTTVGRIVNTLLEPRELIETIMIDFGLDPAGRSKPMLLRDLAQYLVDQRLAGRLVLLVIDEAQNLSLAALEELRMLSNLETEKSKLLQILLVGPGSLRDQLDAPELEQLRKRITVSYHLQPLDAGETAGYINHRLRRAAMGTPLQFPAEATEAIHARSGGLPRIINVICDAALIFGYAEECRSLDGPLVTEAVRELETTGILPPPRDMSEFDDGAHADRAAATRVASPSRPVRETAERGADGDVGMREAELRRLHQLVALQEAELARARELVSRRENELAAREQALLARERRVIEQQRVLSEECRLLRLQNKAGRTSRAVEGTTA